MANTVLAINPKDVFNLFKTKKEFNLLNEDKRKYFENNLLWFIQEFPEPKFENRILLLPNSDDFPITWNLTRRNAIDALNIICNNMQINPSDIKIDFYNNINKEVNAGGTILFLQNDPKNSEAAGMYHSKNENGKYQISIDEDLLKRPDALIGTIAHELSHVKLLGEKQLEHNDEYLTDFACVFFGLGIFAANSAFQFYQQVDRWGYSKIGYLSIEEWAYALALYSFAKGENKPDWTKYLTKTLRKDFERCMNYMLSNESDIFKINEES